MEGQTIRRVVEFLSLVVFVGIAMYILKVSGVKNPTDGQILGVIFGIIVATLVVPKALFWIWECHCGVRRRYKFTSLTGLVPKPLPLVEHRLWVGVNPSVRLANIVQFLILRPFHVRTNAQRFHERPHRVGSMVITVAELA